MADKDLAGRDIEQARQRIRSQMRFPLWLTLLVGVALLIAGALRDEDFHAWLMWMSGAALIALSIGMWCAFDWARLAYGILGAVVCGIFVVELALRGRVLDLEAILKLFQVLFWGWIAVYAFLPSTRRLFAQAKRAPESA